MNSDFVSGHRDRLDIRVEIEVELISVMGLKLALFSCSGSELTWIFILFEIDLIPVRG